MFFMETNVKVIIGFFAFILILLVLYLFIQILPIIGFFVALFGLIVLIVGAYNDDSSDFVYGLLFALFGVLLIAIGLKLNAAIENLGVIEYLKTFFNG